ncbi:MAG: disulfide bond formation protein DsbB [Paraglaciecola psychrophila]|jgi:disulfide bond formation protein DsbB
MTTLPNSRQTHLLIVIAVIGLISYALYSQYVDGLEPCPLCMTQRFFFILIGLFSFICLFHQRPRWYASLGVIASIGGIASAGRQVWLQHLPPELVPACGPSLQYMLETFPLSDTLRTLITGDGNCAEVLWQLFGFSMPEWSLACFLGFMAVSVWQIVREQPATKL